MNSEGETAPQDQKIWKNLGVRAVSAILFVAFCLAPFYFGGLFWLLLVALMSGRMLWEWVRMTDANPTSWAFAIPIAGAVMALTYIHLGNASGAIVAMLVTAVLAWIEKSRRADGLWASLGVLYIVIPALFIIWLRGTTVGFNTSGFRTLFFLIAVVAAADIGAYFGGSYFQGPKIFSENKPQKNVVGIFFRSDCRDFHWRIHCLDHGARFLYGRVICIPRRVVFSLGRFDRKCRQALAQCQRCRRRSAWAWRIIGSAGLANVGDGRRRSVYLFVSKSMAVLKRGKTRFNSRINGINR